MIQGENTCGCSSGRERDLEKIRQGMHLSEEISNIFSALSDVTRIKIVYALAQGELCVHEVAQIINSSVANVSYHLRLLKNLGLAHSRRQGKMIFYSLDDPCVRIIIETAWHHYQHQEKGTVKD